MHNALRSFLGISVSALIAGAWITACGSSDSIDGTASNGTGGNHHGSGGGSAASGNGGGTSASGGGLNLGGGQNDNDGSLTPDASCAGLSVTADRIPLAMYIMQDRSGSMQGQKWSDVNTGLTQFVNDPNSVGIKVALQYFPGAGACDGSGYDTPAVPMGALPANGPNIISSLQSTGPNGNTPTEGALRGLMNFCKQYATANPQEKTIALLVTDGEPNGCNEDWNVLSGIAGLAFSQNPSILVFAMGMSGANFAFLDQVAAAGGTGKSYDLSTGGAGAFSAALQAIAGSVLACDYTMPTTDGGTIDPKKVEVTFTPNGGTPQNLPQVQDASQCGPAGGFYYDNPAAPTKISLCPDTCNAVQADQQGKVDILLGCAVGPIH